MSSEDDKPINPELETALEETIRLRENFWKKYGKLETAALTRLSNPLYRGGPQWPFNRQAFLRVDRSKSILMASDGLSDPFMEDLDLEKGQGLRVEFFIETKETQFRDMDWEQLTATWFFQVLYMVCLNAAHGKNYRELVEEHQVLTIELKHINAPEKFLTEEGRCGAMIGGEVKNIVTKAKGHLGDILLVPVTILTKEELKYAMDGGDAAVRKLRKLFRKKGHYHLSSIDRDSLI